MRRKFETGDKFKLSSDALDNYGAKYQDQTFTVRQWYNHSVSTKNPNWTSDEHGHPGFDETGGSALYGSELNFDLYEWEMVRVSVKKIPNCPNCNGERELSGSGGYSCFFCGMETQSAKA